MELGLDMSLLWNRMCFSRAVSRMGGLVMDDSDGALVFRLCNIQFFMEAGPSPLFRITARFSIPEGMTGVFRGAVVHCIPSFTSVDLSMEAAGHSVDISCLGFAYNDHDLDEAIDRMTSQISNAASVLSWRAAVMAR